MFFFPIRSVSGTCAWWSIWRCGSIYNLPPKTPRRTPGNVCLGKNEGFASQIVSTYNKETKTAYSLWLQVSMFPECNLCLILSNIEGKDCCIFLELDKFQDFWPRAWNKIVKDVHQSPSGWDSPAPPVRCRHSAVTTLSNPSVDQWMPICCWASMLFKILWQRSLTSHRVSYLARLKLI